MDYTLVPRIREKTAILSCKSKSKDIKKLFLLFKDSLDVGSLTIKSKKRRKRIILPFFNPCCKPKK